MDAKPPAQRKMIILIMGAATALLLAGWLWVGRGAYAATTYHSGDTAAFSGTVYEEPFFGPPNYGENPETDRREVARILQLDHPIVFVDSGGTAAQIQEIHLIGFPPLAGKDATFRGRLDEADTGHHRRRVLLVQ
jgi:hypothetical protein